MDFIAGTTYQNASGQFLVLRVDASTLQVEYTSGPQAGKVLTKRTVDMGKLATSERVVPAPTATDESRRRRTAK